MILEFAGELFLEFSFLFSGRFGYSAAEIIDHHVETFVFGRLGHLDPDRDFLSAEFTLIFSGSVVVVDQDHVCGAIGALVISHVGTSF